MPFFIWTLHRRILGCHGVCVNSPLRVYGDLPLWQADAAMFYIIFFAKHRHKLRSVFGCMAVVIHDFGSLNVIQVFGNAVFCFLGKVRETLPWQEATVEEARRRKDVSICIYLQCAWGNLELLVKKPSQEWTEWIQEWEALWIARICWFNFMSKYWREPRFWGLDRAT